MRTLMKFQIPVDAGNQAGPAVEETLRQTLATLKPEAAYFYPEAGTRGGLFVFDLKATSDLPLIAEPLFRRLHAKVQFFPVMNAEDLAEGLKKIQSAA